MSGATVLRPMTADDYAAWQAAAIPGYAADKVAAGQWTADEALARSAAEYHGLLPDGMATADNHLCTIADADGAAVGALWFAVTTKFGARIAYVYDVEVRPEHRRRGHAAAAFRALEAEVGRLGLAGIALHVFGHNHGARALYAGLGFEPTNISLYKAVGAAAERQP
jgi:ribosomal protein S18 acetylase RimI-like enzyme